MCIENIIEKVTTEFQILRLDEKGILGPEGALRLVGAIDFTVKKSKENYCVDYHYNGKGALHEERSWRLDLHC